MKEQPSTVAAAAFRFASVFHCFSRTPITAKWVAPKLIGETTVTRMCALHIYSGYYIFTGDGIAVRMCVRNHSGALALVSVITV